MALHPKPCLENLGDKHVYRWTWVLPYVQIGILQWLFSIASFLSEYPVSCSAPYLTWITFPGGRIWAKVPAPAITDWFVYLSSSNQKGLTHRSVSTRCYHVVKVLCKESMKPQTASPQNLQQKQRDKMNLPNGLLGRAEEVSGFPSLLFCFSLLILMTVSKALAFFPCLAYSPGQIASPSSQWLCFIPTYDHQSYSEREEVWSLSAVSWCRGVLDYIPCSLLTSVSLPYSHTSNTSILDTSW